MPETTTVEERLATLEAQVQDLADETAKQFFGQDQRAVWQPEDGGWLAVAPFDEERATMPDLAPVIAALARRIDHRLECVECGRTTPPDDPAGWRTYLTVDGETGTYCPECAEREFGGEA